MSLSWGNADSPRRNAAFLMSASVLGMVCSAINTILLTRFLGPDGYGALSFAVSIVGLFSPLTLLAFDAIIARYLLSKPETGTVIGTAVVVRSVLAVVVVALLFLLTPAVVVDEQSLSLVYWLSLAVLLQPASIVITFYLTHLRSRYTVALQIIGLVVATSQRVALVWFEADLIWFAIASLIDSALLASLLLALTLLHGRSKLVSLTFNAQMARALIGDSLPLMLAQFAIALNLRIDQVMIGRLMDAKAVGQYAAAARLSELWLFVPAAVSSSFFPRIMALANRKLDQHALTRSLVRYLVGVALVLAMATQLVAEDVVRLIFGAEFAPSAQVLCIHIWSAVFIFASYPINKVMTADNVLWGRTQARALAVLLNVVANLVLIPHFGIVGAAWATLLSYACGWVLFYALIPSTRPYFRTIVASLMPWLKVS